MWRPRGMLELAVGRSIFRGRLGGFRCGLLRGLPTLPTSRSAACSRMPLHHPASHSRHDALHLALQFVRSDFTARCFDPCAALPNHMPPKFEPASKHLCTGLSMSSFRCLTCCLEPLRTSTGHPLVHKRVLFQKLLSQTRQGWPALLKKGASR